MKFSVFADLHCHPSQFMGGTFADLDFIRDRALNEGCAFIIHAGDFCHGMTDGEFVRYYNDFPLPVYHCFGNHDTDGTSREEMLDAYHMPEGHYFFDAEGFRFIVCDPNFYFDGENYIAYSLGNYYAHGDMRDFMPPSELAWLAETVDASPFPCVLISHESFLRADGVQNRDAVREIIRRANKKRRHSVVLCINGHYHRDALSVYEDVAYFDLNSASFDWAPIAHPYFPEELKKQHALIDHSIVYNDPIHAIVTLENDGDRVTVRIDGMESSEFLGVRWADTENPLYDAAGTTNVPQVLSADITLR